MSWWSKRTAWPRIPSAFADAVAANPDAIDLTISNPTRVGFVHEPDAYRHEQPSTYDPQPLGAPAARAAVAHYYEERALAVDPTRVWLCAGTSEAYAHLLTIVADPGDAILVPAPGYPLLDHLTDAAGVRRVPYPVVYEDGWRTDVGTLAAALRAQPRARAVVVVAPGNPTGAYLSTAERDAIFDACAAHRCALIVDEVFSDYPIEPRQDRVRNVGAGPPVPTFVLSGLSKVAALPQVKLSWIVAHGPDALVAEFLGRAEVLGDAYLCVSSGTLRAAPSWLTAAPRMQDRIRERIVANVAALDRALANTPVQRLAADAGWTALLRLPSLDLDDDAWSRDLIENAGVIVQPGYLFDLPSPPRVAVSLITPEDSFSAGIHRLLARVSARVG